MPSSDVQFIGGGRVPEDADFFATPPPDIGRIIAAYTSIHDGRGGQLSARNRIQKSLFGAVAGLMITVAGWYFLRLQDQLSVYSVAVIGLALGAWIVFGNTSCQWACAFIGTEGVYLRNLNASQNVLILFSDVQRCDIGIVGSSPGPGYKSLLTIWHFKGDLQGLEMKCTKDSSYPNAGAKLSDASYRSPSDIEWPLLLAAHGAWQLSAPSADS